MAKTMGLDTLEQFTEHLKTKGARGSEIFYRGHSKTTYPFAPSIYRKYSACDNGVLLEDKLLREILVHNPDDFISEHTTLEKLVLIQHSGLPTRLLDITSNPLVALYFCCKSNPDERGLVYLIKVKNHAIKYYDSDTVAILSNLARLNHSEKSGLDTSLDDKAFNKHLITQRLIHNIIEEKHHFRSIINPLDIQKTLCVKTKKSNPRIVAQSGAFLLFGMKDENTCSPLGGDISIEKIPINAKSKTKILHQLDRIGINESVMFPELDKSAAYIKAKFLGK